ncbi:MAG: helix-turn-helix domain-containing protein [Muribaculaceae bacterium]
MSQFKDIHKINIGPIIKRRLDGMGISYTHFAQLIHVSRPTLYGILASKSIDIDRLILISEILEYDFIRNVYYKADRFGKNVVDIPVDCNLLKDNTIALNLTFVDNCSKGGVNNTDANVNIADSQEDKL